MTTRVWNFIKESGSLKDVLKIMVWALTGAFVAGQVWSQFQSPVRDVAFSEQTRSKISALEEKANKNDVDHATIGGKLDTITAILTRMEAQMDRRR